MAIPLHLAVHLAGVAVAGGLALLVLLRPAGAVTGAATRTSAVSFPPLAFPARIALATGASLLAGAHLVLGALLADPAGWPLLLRAAGYAAIAVGAAGGTLRRPHAPTSGPRTSAVVPALLLAAVAPVAAPAVLPLAAGLAGVAASVAAAWGVLGRGRRVLPLVAALALYAAADLVVADRPGAAAGLSIAGSLAAGAWVLERAGRRSLAGRFTGVSLVTLLILVVGLGAASGLVLASDVRAEQRDRLVAIAGAQASDLVDRTGAALDATAAAVAGDTLVEPLVAADAALAGDRVAPVLALPEVEVAVLTDAAGALVAARGLAADGVDALPPAAGNVIAGADVTVAALGGQLARGVVDVGDGSLLVVGAAPVAPRDETGEPQLGRQVGALVLGRDLTSAPVLERVAADTATDVAIVVGGRVAASTLPADAADAVASSDGTVRIAGTDRVTAAAPLGDGAQLVLVLPPDTATDAARTATRSAFLLAVAGLVLAGSLAAVLARRTVEPVAQLTDAAERVAAGDLDTRVSVARDDEVGRLAAAFDGMTESLADRDRDLRSSLAVQASLRDRLEAVTASMGEALLATAQDGTVTTANPAAAALLGVTGEADLVGRPLAAVLRGTAEGGHDLSTVLGTGDGDAVTVRGELTATGRVIEATASPLADAADVRGGRVYVIRDITERVLADRVRTEVIANLSHELNTPLTPIKAFLEVIASRDALDARFAPMLELAREGRVRLERTIAALVDLAELEGGRTSVTTEPLAVAEVVGELLGRWQGREPDRTITRRVGRGTPPVLGDRALVGRVLDALVDNAVKFAPGTVRVHADAVGPEVRIRVRDDGPGVPASRREEVFELFVQADGSSTRAVGGLGIGLPTAARIAALLGGRLELHDAPGGGTDACLYLPAARASEDAEPAP